ncbi:hypothetical protein HJC23_011776 [Cyclotella cryptica]|uniref:Uncharacterized protein n=1 Tax=Cyclotella cryptica TaxID=29204 RepID=A0ABD3PHS0_9STRA|eukprot:CCRYP_014317-RA/>CCRYP_014317-RA protein AED:0.42 eAED:0.42 QI:0/-1/0/1/-1/1/1/0/187
MPFPQNLFRRHAANRSRDSSDNPANSPVGTDNSPPNGDASMNTSNSSAMNINASTSTSTENENSTNDEEQEIVVQVPIAPHLLPSNNLTVLTSPTATQLQQRRQDILREVERVQRANFIHFALLCLVPTSLLLIVIAAIVSEGGECLGAEGITICEREARTFVNAFTTRCVCDAVRSVVKEDGNDDY